MDIQKSFTYFLDDEGWVTKIIIGAVMAFFSWLIIPAIILMGYGIAITRNVMRREEKPLPSWDNWGTMLKDGFNLAIAYLVYMLPFIFLLCSGIFLAVGLSSSASGDAGDILVGLGIVTVLAIFCIFFLFLLVLMFIAPAITLQYVREDSLGACFQFGEIINITRENIGDVVMVLVVAIALSFALSFIGIIPIIGWLLIIAGNIFVVVVVYHLYGQIGLKLGGSAAPDLLIDTGE